MSGGVDSSAAALLLKEQGYDVVGVSMQVWDYRKNGGSASRATCCAPSDFDDARQIAENCDFPYYVFDFEQSFRESVIEPFINSYLEGRTPNPCLNCNRKVKFRQLRQRALALESKWVATGHFAQIKQLKDESLGLFTSVDGDKDQTYFLYSMTQDDLKTTLFPVGGMKKPEVRQLLKSRGFEIASKEESQDICFVSSSVSKFIEQQRGVQPSGLIVDTKGEELGTHSGIHQYTVGQRKGLGISSRDPLYVLNINSETTEVTVGPKQQLERSTFFVQDMNWISGVVPQKPIEAIVKVRYRHPGIRCLITPIPAEQADGVKCQFDFLDDWTAVSPGQAAVCYALETDTDGCTQVLGGGVIC
ncbi:UNVERIFIED_CONTAM: hypothetical protein GTU68_025148 [Idotea baltica]|nr:hypothetical protein [Idotea baltica]